MGTRKERLAPARSGAVLLGVVALLAAGPAAAQAGDDGTPPHRKSVTQFGAQLSDREAGALLGQMRALTEAALAASRAAEQAADVAAAKAAADRVIAAVWGHPSGIAGAAAGEVRVLGWKEKWQVTGAEFDPKFQERLGTEPPTITDPEQLGVVGRGRAARTRLERIVESGSPEEKAAAERAIASLNNVIGWMHVTKGFKVREVQPRISLTYLWDQPAEFWNSTADTGWLHEAYAQAVNILKTDYAGDVEAARTHAADLTRLLERALQGVDADANGAVEPKIMEGGLLAALTEAGRAGLAVQ